MQTCSCGGAIGGSAWTQRRVLIECQEKNSTRRARGRRGDSLQLGHDPGGMHGEVDGAVSGGRGRATTALDGPAASGGRARVRCRSCSKDSTPKSRRRADYPSVPASFQREGTRAQAGGCPRGVPTRLDARRRDLGETRSVSARRFRFTSPRRGFLEKREKNPPRLECVSRRSRPEKCSHGAAMPRFPLNSVSQLV